MTRTQMFLVFFSVVLTIYGLINAYIFMRGCQAFPSGSVWRPVFVGVFWLLASAYIVGRILERTSLVWLSNPVIWIGSFWLAAMAYFFLILILLDLARIVNYVVPFFPDFLTRDPGASKRIVAGVVIAVVVVTVVLGHLNARSPRIRTIELSIPKKSALPAMTIAVASDVHLGTLVCREFFDRIVAKINTVDADLVLFAGDIVDEDIEPVMRQDLGESLRRIKSRYGTYGITGNHEYIGGVEEACAYLTAHGLIMLRDSSAVIADAVTLVGREDTSSRGFSGRTRKPLSVLMADVDRSMPVILLDHQPQNLEQAVENGADLQLSGHTHHGQLWPFGSIAELVYEVSWGYKKKGDTHIYVSCGVGTWGPPVRTGNTPEIVVLKLAFTGK